MVNRKRIYCHKLENEKLDLYRTRPTKMRKAIQELVGGKMDPPFVDRQWFTEYRALTKLVRYLLIGGNFSAAVGLVDRIRVLLMFKHKIASPDAQLYLCIDRVAQHFRAKPRRVGGTVYLVPQVLTREVARRKGLKSMVVEARKRMRSGGDFVGGFVEVVTEILKGKGPCLESVRKQEIWLLENKIYMSTLSGGRRHRRGHIKC